MLLKETQVCIFATEKMAEDKLKEVKETQSVLSYKIENKVSKKHDYWLLTFVVEHTSLAEAKEYFEVE